MVCIADLVSVAGGSTTLKIELVHKNREDVGDGTVLSGDITMTTKSRSTPKEWTGLKEMVRFKYTVSTADIGWVTFRILTPSWFDAVKA